MLYFLSLLEPAAETAKGFVIVTAAGLQFECIDTMPENLAVPNFFDIRVFPMTNEGLPRKYCGKILQP